jgi:hypothetical protein
MEHPNSVMNDLSVHTYLPISFKGMKNKNDTW